MARSLTIAKEDNPTTSPLLTGFLLVAVAVLALSALAGFGGDDGSASADETPPTLSSP